MRLLAPLGLLLLLTACNSAGGGIGTMIGNPADGWLDFIGDTVSFRTNPNRPEPESDTIRRVMGQEIEAEPLTTETGNIWPAMPRREPTAVDLENAPASAKSPAANIPTAKPVGSAAVVPPVQIAAPPPPTPAIMQPVRPIPPATPIASGSSLPTPGGNAILTTSPNGIITYTLPSGAGGRAIDNGNGTLTLIGNDGQVISVPAPR